SWVPSWAQLSLFPTPDGEAAVWLLAQQPSPHGEYWMPSISGWRNAEPVYLSSVLDPEELIPARYYLTPRACNGVLRRARNNGAEIPERLKAALEAQIVAGGGTVET